MNFKIALLVLSAIFLQTTRATDFNCKQCGDNPSCIKACDQQTTFFTVVCSLSLLFVICSLISFCLIWSSPQIENEDEYNLGTNERYDIILQNEESRCTRYDCGCTITTFCMIIILISIIAFCGLYPEGGKQRWNNDLYEGIQIAVIIIGSLIICFIIGFWCKRKNLKSPKIDESAFNDIHIPPVTEYQTKTVTEYRYVMPNGRIR